MNEYLSKLYGWVSSKDASFSSKLTEQEFIEKMENDPEYNNKIYSWVSGKDAMFSTRLPLNDFQEKTLKKKEIPIVSESESGAGLSEPTEIYDPITGVLLGTTPAMPVKEEGYGTTEQQVQGIAEYFDRADVTSEELALDPNLQAAINSGVISQQDLIDAGYQQPDQVSTISSISKEKERFAKNKISALRRKTEEEIDLAINQGRLNESYAYEKSASEDTFVEDVYGEAQLALMNINPKDFDGFLEERGYKKDFLDKQERGLFEKKFGTYSDPKIGYELEKTRMLNLYVAEQLTRDVDYQKLLEEKETGVNPDYTDRKYSFKPSSANVNTQMLSSYIEKNMPNLTRELKETERKNAKLYQDLLDGGIDAGTFSGTLLKEGWKGFEDRIQNLSASMYGLLGKSGIDYFSNIADATRMQMDQEKLFDADNLSYAYVSGNRVKVNGRDYLVDENDQIYDLEIKAPVSQFLTQKMAQTILNEAQTNGVKAKSFSSRGIAYQTSNVLGDMVVQIALTRAAGNTMRSAGAFTEGLGVLGKTKNILRSVPMSRGMSSAIIAQATMGASSGYEQTLKLAKDAGLNEEEAIELAQMGSTQMAVLYALTAPISPQTKATEAFFGKIKGETLKKAIEAYKKMGQKGFMDVFKETGTSALNLLGEGVKEAVQENIQQAGEMLIVNRNINEEAGTKISEDTITGDSFINTTILSLTAGMLMPGAGGVVNAASRKARDIMGMGGIDRMKSLDYLVRNEEKVNQLLDSQLDQGVYDQQQVDALRSEIKTYKDGIGKIPKNLKAETALEIMGDIAKISDLESKKKQLDPAFHQEVDDEIKSIREQIKEKRDAIQEQETGNVPDAKPAEGVQEVEEEVRVTPEEETEVGYTAPETVEQRREENELLSAKEAEERGLERIKGQRWVVVNKVTGKLVYAPVKAEAQAIIDNMDYDYGEGDMVSKQELDNIRTPKDVRIESEVQKLRDLFAAPEQRSQIDNAEKALSAVAPDVKIVVHENEDSYAEATNEQNRTQKTAGEYNPATKTIHINATKANVRTVAHETFHAILLNSVKTDTEAQRITEAMMKAVAKSASPELKSYLDEFASNYSENIQAEEKLAELVGKLASEYDSLPKPTQTVVKRWLDRLAKAFGLKPFTDTEVIDVLNTISRKIATGEAIVSEDVKAITEGASTFFSGPTTISRKQAAEEVQVSDTPANLSFVTSDDIIDIESLIDEIESKGQKVWFWVADQLGRGMYMDTQVGTEHFLDAGPSYALDPDNRSRNVIWATGKKESEVTRLIGDSDYIFIISGSPIKSKLFNKRVINILESRVGDYDAFKSGALNSNPTKPFRDILEKHDSWESLTESPDRKKLLNAIEDVKKKKGTPLKTFLQDNNAFIDIESLRDGFYAQNDFQMNDVMLVLKPTGFGGKSNHSTYENDILGEVVGVPNKRINAYDLMPGEVKAKYSEAMSEAQKAQVVAPYGIGVRDVSSRKQLSETDNATELVGVAKSQGISDAGIRQYAKENNIPLTLVNKAIAAYDAEKRIAGQRAEKMYTGEGNVVSNFLDRLRRKTLSSKGFMPKSMHVGKEVMEGAIAANAKQAEKTLKDLQRYLKKYKGNQNDLIESFDSYMRGYEVIENLPEDLQPIAYAMREHIDGLSKQLIDSGAVSNISFDDLTKAQQEQLIKDYGTEEDARANYRSLQENIMANLGSYMTRSYEVFDNKDYKPTEEVLLAAENKLREVYRKTAEKIAKKENNSVEDVLDRLVSKKIQDILTPEGANAFLTGSKLGSKKTGILRQRLDIPSEIRALMGEYTDPAVNYARSIQKMSALVANQQFLNKMKEAGEGVFFFNEPTGDYNVRIAAEGSSTMNPLNGMYTTKEIAEAMTNSGIVDIKDPLLKTAYNFWLKTVGLVKYSKTILSPATHAKNILGNVAFMAYNGYTNPKEYFKALDVIFTDLKSLPKSEQRAKMQEYIKAGIINQSVNLKEIQAIFESKDKIEDILTKRFNNPKNSPITKLNNLRKKIGKGFQSAYQAEDDFFKIVAYENEKSRYAKAFFNKGFNELTEDQKKEVTDYVSEIVKNILPNYSRIGELGKIMKAFPVAGTFISFQIEAMRTAYNTIDLAFNEMKDSKTRSIGVKRLAGIMSVIGLKAAMFGAFGLGDDEDETKEASRAFLPPWAKNSNTVITQLNDGKFKYINFSASDPHGFLDKAMIGYMRGESVGEGMMSVVDELVGPFYQSDILFNTLFNLKENRDDYGREIWNETDNANDMTEKIMSRLWKTFEPGGVTSIRKVVGSDVPFNELVGQLTGFKEWEVDAKNSSLFKAIDIKKRSSLASKDYSKAYYEMKDGKISQDELDQRYEEANLRYQDVMKDAIELYKSGLRLGISREDMIKQMAGSGRLSKDEILAIERGALPNKNRHLERKKKTSSGMKYSWE